MNRGLPSAPWLWWGEVPRDEAAEPGETQGEGDFTSRARSVQSHVARRTLEAGLREFGLLPEDGRSRVGFDGPGAIRLVTVDGQPTAPPVQFSLAHTATSTVAAARTADGPPSGLGVDIEDDWGAAERNLDLFGTWAELTLLAGAVRNPHPLHLRCVRETLAKASGLGFRIPPRRYRLHSRANALLLEIDEGKEGGPTRPATIRFGTRRLGPATAWAIAELPLMGSAHGETEDR